MAPKKIILLAGRGISTNVVYHMIDALQGIDTVILEEPVDRLSFLKKRIKKSGFIKVAGQVLFQLFVVPPLRFFSKKRSAAIWKEYGLNTAPIPVAKIRNVPSVNDEETMQLLQEIAPALVIVNGTRIISKKILAAVPCKFINMHAGITPKYRGVHGAYWALVNGDIGNCGVTVHLVDPGIDTGAILYQEKIDVSKEDNFCTYPQLQLARGIPLLAKAINDVLKGQPQPIDSTKKESNLWQHPAIWEYLYHRFTRNVK